MKENGKGRSVRMRGGNSAKVKKKHSRKQEEKEHVVLVGEINMLTILNSDRAGGLTLFWRINGICEDWVRYENFSLADNE